MYKNFSIKFRLALLTIVLRAMAVLVGVVGLVNQSATNTALGTVYNDRVVALEYLSNILSMMQQNQNTLRRAALEDGSGNQAALTEVEDRIKQISGIWTTYMATYLTAEEKALALSFSKRGERDQASHRRLGRKGRGGQQVGCQCWRYHG